MAVTAPGPPLAGHLASAY